MAGKYWALVLFVWFMALGAIGQVANGFEKDYKNPVITCLLGAWTWIYVTKVHPRLVRIRDSTPTNNSRPPASNEEAGPTLAQLRRAVRVTMTYRDATGDVTQRQVDVRGLSGRRSAQNSIAGEVELVQGHCHLRNEPRTFRVDRIEELILPDGEVLEGRTPRGKRRISVALAALGDD